MKKNNLLIKSLFMSTVFIFGALVWTACTPEKPSPELIEKAKIQTLDIIDSLNQDENTIIGNVELNSEFFDKNAVKYVINYKIETGLDSAHITKTKATAFLDREDDSWTYRFVFDKTYHREINK